MKQLDPATFWIPFGTLIVLLSGYLLNKRGQASQERQQMAASRLAETGQVIEGLTTFVALQRKELTAKARENERLEKRLRDTISYYERRLRPTADLPEPTEESP